jgi:two-component sensor histidine kinase
MVPTDEFGTVDAVRELLGTLLDQTRDCVKLLDRQGTIRYVNGRGASTMAPCAPSEFAGLAWVDSWPLTVRPTVERAVRDALAGKAARFTAERMRGDRQNWWDVTVAPAGSGSASEYLLVIARDITSEIEERERAEAVTAEMRHRLRNAMAIAAGLMSIAARGKPELQDFTEEVTARLALLGRVQALVLDDASEKSFAQFVTLLGKIYPSLEIGPLPDVELDDRLMQAIALSFGELATNSLKYGALKRGAAVRICGCIVDDEIELLWKEETVFGQTREGAQGFNLIERIVRASGGRVERDITDREFTARAVFPTRAGYT